MKLLKIKWINHLETDCLQPCMVSIILHHVNLPYLLELLVSSKHPGGLVRFAGSGRYFSFLRNDALVQKIWIIFAVKLKVHVYPRSVLKFPNTEVFPCKHHTCVVSWTLCLLSRLWLSSSDRSHLPQPVGRDLLVPLHLVFHINSESEERGQNDACRCDRRLNGFLMCHFMCITLVTVKETASVSLIWFGYCLVCILFSLKSFYSAWENQLTVSNINNT